ncbi:putative NBS-LRR resistance protein [Trifolium pratense]|uniref:Putative NBS-LRR resistance protein n=1 Tax=Trifolium pratense TaxID=57577 RepID=A0A2K3LMZ2_TRIPR|nr:putative NBS-LRR resistance protein [Trifolium pratense]
MAEQIPYGVATSLINMLASAAFRKFGRIYGVTDQLERLKNTVESIRAVLLDAEDKQEQNLKALPDWICNLSLLHVIILMDCVCLASLPEDPTNRWLSALG